MSWLAGAGILLLVPACSSPRLLPREHWAEDFCPLISGCVIEGYEATGPLHQQAMTEQSVLADGLDDGPD